MSIERKRTVRVRLSEELNEILKTVKDFFQTGFTPRVCSSLVSSAIQRVFETRQACRVYIVLVLCHHTRVYIEIVLSRYTSVYIV